MQQNEILIQAVKSDGTVYRWWDAVIEEKNDERVIARLPAGRTVFEPKKSWVSEVNIRFYYWKDRPYNLLEVYSDTGEPLELYVNIASPMDINETRLSYCDYELDVIKKTGYDTELIDEDEFSEATEAFNYNEDFIRKCYKAADDAADLVNSWSWKGWV